MTNLDDIYISVDIETDGPVPFKNSMIDLGAAAFTLQKGIIGSFSQAISPLPGSSPDPKTMEEFWKSNLNITCRYNQLLQEGHAADVVMKDFINWVTIIADDKKPVFMAKPTGYDFTWTYAYMMYFVGYSPFGFTALDFRSLISGYLKIPYRAANKRNFPKSWFSKKKHTHNAIDDAIEQAELFINAMREIYGITSNS